MFEYRGKTLPRSPELLIRILGLPYKENLRIEEALTHRSASHERGRKNPVPNYERLEFLGDRVIGLIVSEYLLNTWPAANEGDIGQIFSTIVSTQTLASISRRMDLGYFMILGKGSHSSGDRDNPSILADTLESVTACLYLEYGLETVRQVMIPWFAQPLREIVIGLEQANLLKESRDSRDKKEPEPVASPVAPIVPRRGQPLNYKMLVQKWSQRNHGVQPDYRIIEESGPPHQRKYRVGAFVKDELIATGETTTKRGASILAARHAWETVNASEGQQATDQAKVLEETPAGEPDEVSAGIEQDKPEPLVQRGEDSDEQSSFEPTTAEEEEQARHSQEDQPEELVHETASLGRFGHEPVRDMLPEPPATGEEKREEPLEETHSVP